MSRTTSPAERNSVRHGLGRWCVRPPVAGVGGAR